MGRKDTTLESLAKEGRDISTISHASDAHHEFLRWAGRVADWLDERFSGTGLSAEWSGLPVSTLVVNSQYDSSYSARVQFNKVVSARLRWLGELGRATREQDVADADTKESDTVFAAIDALVQSAAIPNQFKSVVVADIVEAQKSYKVGAYKACVVMLGAALEGLMLGTLQRSDVIIYLATSTIAPKAIQKLGTRDPQLADKIGIYLTFEDYKVCIHELIPGSEALGVDNIQDFRNAIHAWKVIQEPLKYGAFDRSRALHYLASLHKIVEALHGWKPDTQ